MKNISVFLTHKDEVQRNWFEVALEVARRHDIVLHEHWCEVAGSQARLVGDCVMHEECDAIVMLATTVTGFSSLLCEAASRGRSVVLLNRTSCDMSDNLPWSWPRLMQDFPKVLVATTVPDAVETGRIQGMQCQALIPKRGKVLCVLGDPNSADARERLAGFQEVVAKNPAITVSKVVGGFQSDVANRACARWLSIALMNPTFRLDLVSTQGEAMLPGIRSAFEQAAKEHNRPDLERVPMTSVDGLQRWKDEIDSGKMAATVEQPSRVAAAVELLAQFWRTGARPAKPIVLLPVSSYPSLDKLAKRAVREDATEVNAAPS